MPLVGDLPSPEEVEKMSALRIREVLRHLRQNPVRRSKLVVRCGERISHQKLSMGSEQEKYMVFEQVAVACLDCNHIELAEWFLQEIEEKFGQSSRRVMRLRGMMEEAKGEYDKARRTYERVLKQCETDNFAVLRICAVLKAQGKLIDAIRYLETHVGTVQTSEEVWKELLNMHVIVAHSRQGADWSKALACCEELVLQDPHNHVWLCIYAELKYSEALELPTSFQKEALMLSRKYFSQSLVANDAKNNMRAVWGLWQTCKKIDAMNFDLNPAERAEQTEVRQWAQDRIQASYRGTETPVAAAVALMTRPVTDID